jgi:seryl-tRNA synthetase
MELIFIISCITLYIIIFLTIDEIVSNIIYLKNERKTLYKLINELKKENDEDTTEEINKLKTEELNYIDLKEEINKLKADTKSFETFKTYAKEEFKEVFESIRFSNDEIVRIKNVVFKSSQASETQSLDLKDE